MATYTVTFQAPTTYVPATFSVEISPAEAQKLIAEIGPIMAGNITIGNAAASLPSLAALFALLEQSVTQTATVASAGASAPPLTGTVVL